MSPWVCALFLNCCQSLLNIVLENYVAWLVDGVLKPLGYQNTRCVVFLIFYLHFKEITCWRSANTLTSHCFHLVEIHRLGMWGDTQVWHVAFLWVIWFPPAQRLMSTHTQTKGMICFSCNRMVLYFLKKYIVHFSQKQPELACSHIFDILSLCIFQCNIELISRVYNQTRLRDGYKHR